MTWTGGVLRPFMAERRRDRRMRLAITGSAYLHGRTMTLAHGAVTHDLSLSGCVIECSAMFEIGAQITISLGDACYGATVKWRNGQSYGCEFHKRLSAQDFVQLRELCVRQAADTWNPAPLPPDQEASNPEPEAARARMHSA
jgi:hypothetical protein